MNLTKNMVYVIFFLLIVLANLLLYFLGKPRYEKYDENDKKIFETKKYLIHSAIMNVSIIILFAIILHIMFKKRLESYGTTTDLYSSSVQNIEIQKDNSLIDL